MKNKISVIIPAYNVEQYIFRCLESVVSQTYSNLEIIVIDDGSTDSTYERAIEFQEKDSRVKVVTKENEGLGLTRNYGVNLATGDYITFIDSDDYIKVDAIETLFKYIDNADIVIGGHYFDNEPQHLALKEGYYCDSEIQSLLLPRIMGNSPKKKDALTYTATGKLFRKKLFDNGVSFKSEREYIWEDLVFSLDVLQQAKGVYLLDKQLYYYTYNPDSLTHSYNPRKFRLIMFLYFYMLDKISELSLDEEAKVRLDTNFIGHIRTCIKLEVLNVKRIGRKTVINNISSICKDDGVKSILLNYSADNYTLIQRIYSSAILHENAELVYFLTKVQNFRKKV